MAYEDLEKEKERSLINWKRRIRALFKINPKLICEGCGLNDIRCLTVNHINGHSLMVKERIGGSGMYDQILRGEEDLLNLNILCGNCQILWEVEIRETRYQFLPPGPCTKTNIDFELIYVPKRRGK